MRQSTLLSHDDATWWALAFAIAYDMEFLRHQEWIVTNENLRVRIGLRFQFCATFFAELLRAGTLGSTLFAVDQVRSGALADCEAAWLSTPQHDNGDERDENYDGAH